MPEGKLYDIGVDRRDAAEPISAPGAKRYYPGIEVNDEILPLLKDAVPGTDKIISAKIRITGTRIPEDYDDIQRGNFVCFDFIEMGEPGSFQKSEQ